MQSYSYESREILMAYVQDNFKIFYNTLKKSHFCHNVVTITVFFFFPSTLGKRVGKRPLKSVRLGSSKFHNADERPGAVCRDAKAALFPTFKKSWVTALQTHFKARVKYFHYFHHVTSSLGWILIWQNPHQMITALLQATRRTLCKKLKKIFNVPYVIYR